MVDFAMLGGTIEATSRPQDYLLPDVTKVSNVLPRCGSFNANEWNAIINGPDQQLEKIEWAMLQQKETEEVLEVDGSYNIRSTPSPVPWADHAIADYSLATPSRLFIKSPTHGNTETASIEHNSPSKSSVVGEVFSISSSDRYIQEEMAVPDEENMCAMLQGKPEDSQERAEVEVAVSASCLLIKSPSHGNVETASNEHNSPSKSSVREVSSISDISPSDRCIHEEMAVPDEENMCETLQGKPEDNQERVVYCEVEVALSEAEDNQDNKICIVTEAKPSIVHVVNKNTVPNSCAANTIRQVFQATADVAKDHNGMSRVIEEMTALLLSGERPLSPIRPEFLLGSCCPVTVLPQLHQNINLKEDEVVEPEVMRSANLIGMINNRTKADDFETSEEVPEEVADIRPEHSNSKPVNEKDGEYLPNLAHEEKNPLLFEATVVDKTKIAEGIETSENNNGKTIEKKEFSGFVKPISANLLGPKPYHVFLESYSQRQEQQKKRILEKYCVGSTFNLASCYSESSVNKTTSADLNNISSLNEVGDALDVATDDIVLDITRNISFSKDNLEPHRIENSLHLLEQEHSVLCPPVTIEKCEDFSPVVKIEDIVLNVETDVSQPTLDEDLHEPVFTDDNMPLKNLENSLEELVPKKASNEHLLLFNKGKSSGEKPSSTSIKDESQPTFDEDLHETIFSDDNSPLKDLEIPLKEPEPTKATNEHSPLFDKGKPSGECNDHRWEIPSSTSGPLEELEPTMATNEHLPLFDKGKPSGECNDHHWENLSSTSGKGESLFEVKADSDLHLSHLEELSSSRQPTPEPRHAIPKVVVTSCQRSRWHSECITKCDDELLDLSDQWLKKMYSSDLGKSDVGWSSSKKLKKVRFLDAVVQIPSTEPLSDNEDMSDEDSSLPVSPTSLPVIVTVDAWVDRKVVNTSEYDLQESTDAIPVNSDVNVLSKEGKLSNTPKPDCQLPASCKWQPMFLVQI